MSLCLPGGTEIALRASAVLWLLTGTVTPTALGGGGGAGNGCCWEEGEQMLSFLPGHGVIPPAPPGLTPAPPAQPQMLHCWQSAEGAGRTLRITGEGWGALSHPPLPCPAHTTCTVSAALCYLFPKHPLVLPAPWQGVQCCVGVMSPVSQERKSWGVARSPSVATPDLGGEWGLLSSLLHVLCAGGCCTHLPPLPGFIPRVPARTRS